MRTQNKSLYTRRFNTLKTKLREHFDDSVVFSDTAALRWGPECCLIAHDGSLGFTIHFTNESGDIENLVQITKTPYCALTGLVGVHVSETDLNHILDAIDTALRDGFENIYIRSLSKIGGAQ